MIYKSYLVEQNINSISQNLVLFYGENLGLKDDFKDIIKKNNKDTYIKNFDQDQILSNKIDYLTRSNIKKIIDVNMCRYLYS